MLQRWYKARCNRSRDAHVTVLHAMLYHLLVPLLPPPSLTRFTHPVPTASMTISSPSPLMPPSFPHPFGTRCNYATRPLPCPRHCHHPATACGR
ncbi:hypothetical protein K439DRAFT_493746 [Ramaria rubella]|nr:hypothetical protein K439DRAFT_493746 [Ramaria rubella]